MATQDIILTYFDLTLNVSLEYFMHNKLIVNIVIPNCLESEILV